MPDPWTTLLLVGYTELDPVGCCFPEITVIGLDLATSLGAIAATLWNIGPGFGSVGPTDNYAFVPVTGKWLLSFYMLMGRLELFTVIILFTPSYWRK